MGTTEVVLNREVNNVLCLCLLRYTCVQFYFTFIIILTCRVIIVIVLIIGGVITFICCYCCCCIKDTTPSTQTPGPHLPERTVRTYNVTTANQLQPKGGVQLYPQPSSSGFTSNTSAPPPVQTASPYNVTTPFNQPSSSDFTSNTSAPPPVQTTSPYNVTTPFNQPSSSDFTSNTSAPPPYCETEAPPPYCEVNMTQV